MKKQLLLIALFFSSLISNAQSWTAIGSPSTATINSCSFVNETTGWIVTDTAIFKTTDGGASWSNQFYPVTPPNTERNFKSVHFINANVGIIACDNFLSAGYDPQLVSSILWTDNGGADWVYKNLGATDFNDYDAKLVTPLIAYTIGKAGSFKKTTDGGTTWTNYNFPANSVSAGLKLATVSQSTVYFGGIQNGFIHYGIFGQTVNSGTNWIVSNASPSAITAIYFLDANEGWLGGNSGFINHTTDNGVTWNTAVTGIDSKITDIVFTDSLHGWATTDQGEIIKTTDGGATWTIDYQGNSSVNSICMTIPNSVGYAVGDDGLLLKHNGTLAVEENTNTAGFRIYPNPAHDILHMEFNNMAVQNTVLVYNVFGQIVQKIVTMNEKNLSFTTGELAKGVYYLQLSQDGKTFKASKLIIE